MQWISDTPIPAEVASNGPLDGLLFERSRGSCRTCARNTRGRQVVCGRRPLKSQDDANPKPALPCLLKLSAISFGDFPAELRKQSTAWVAFVFYTTRQADQG
eukprot:s39_g40.t1